QVPSRTANAQSRRQEDQDQQQPAIEKRLVLPLEHLGTGHDLTQPIGRRDPLRCSLNLVGFHLGSRHHSQGNSWSAGSHVTLFGRRQSWPEVDNIKRWDLLHALILRPERIVELPSSFLGRKSLALVA